LLLRGIVLSDIVFLSNDRKKNLLVSFCDAYKSVLSKHSLFSTYALSYLIKEIGLPVSSLLDDDINGYQQIISKIYCKEIVLIIFFRDSFIDYNKSSLEHELFRVCDMHNIPYATNLAMAEILLNYLILEK